MAKKRPPNKAEREHISAVVALGCIISGAPAVPHHLPRQGGKKDHYRVIPLSPYHHTDGPIGEAVHQGRKSFEANYGTELELLDEVNERLGIIK